MKHRKLGYLDWTPSALGFGCMRLPTSTGSALSPDILEDDAISMLRYGIDNGINYIDTAYKYHSGASENVVGKALKDGYRDKVKLATKSPIFLMNSADEYEIILDDQLKKLDVDFIDFYLFHNINKNSWKNVKNFDLLAKAERAQKAGKIGHIAFSFHDDYELFEEVINSYDKWLFAQIQYNFMDANYQAGTKGAKLAASKGVGIVAMEPLKGGKLSNPIPAAKALMQKHGVDNLTRLSLNWLWNQPEVSVVLSGMTLKQQVEDNLGFADGPYAISESEAALIEEIKELYASKMTVPCTGCAYCMPCPQNINIPHMLYLYNEGIAYEYMAESKRTYGVFGRPAQNCIECRQCEEKCPQSIEISGWMKKTHEALAQ